MEDFDWAHAGAPIPKENIVGGRWHQAFARLKWAAEQAKIELSSRGKEKAALDPDTVSSLKDENSEEIAIAEFEMDISRADLVRVAEPFIMRAAEIAKRVLKERNLPSSAIEKVILVGGPTVALYFRQMLEESLRIPLDFSVDPFTVVARGAAKFAGTQRLTARTSAPIAVGEYSVELKHKPVGIESAPIVGGKVSGSSTQDFTGFTLELVNTKTQWRSGKIALGADGVFIANLYAEKGERNTFAIELYDPNTRKQKVNPTTLAYTIDMVVDEQPLINSMGVSRGQNDYLKFFEKGSGLPLKKTHDLKTKVALRQGQSADVIRIPVVEGENELADRNRLTGVLEIRGDNDKVHRDVPAGSDVEITLSFHESRTITVRAYLPLLDKDFQTTIEWGRHTPNTDFLKQDFDGEMKRFREVKAKVSDAGADSAGELVQQIEQSALLQEVKELLPAAKGDPDAALKCEKRLLELKLKLDEAADASEWPALVSESRDWLGWLQKAADQCGNEQQRQKAENLTGEIEKIIRERKTDYLRRRIDRAKDLYFQIVMSQPGWWVDQFQRMDKQQQDMTDQGRAARLLDQGRDCMGKSNATGLQNVVRQLYELLPREIEESIKRGYDPGIH